MSFGSVGFSPHWPGLNGPSGPTARHPQRSAFPSGKGHARHLTTWIRQIVTLMGRKRKKKKSLALGTNALRPHGASGVLFKHAPCTWGKAAATTAAELKEDLVCRAKL